MAICGLDVAGAEQGLCGAGQSNSESLATCHRRLEAEQATPRTSQRRGVSRVDFWPFSVRCRLDFSIPSPAVCIPGPLPGPSDTPTRVSSIFQARGCFFFSSQGIRKNPTEPGPAQVRRLSVPLPRTTRSASPSLGPAQSLGSFRRVTYSASKT